MMGLYKYSICFSPQISGIYFGFLKAGEHFSSVRCQRKRNKIVTFSLGNTHSFAGNSISQFQLVSVFGHQRS